MVDIEALRKKALDKAIQGMLTPNDLSECAPVLPEVNDFISEEEKMFDIPANWRWSKIGWVMDIERGGSPRPIKSFLTDDENGINWIKIGDVEKNGKYIMQTKEKIKPEGEKKSRKVHPGDFLLTNSMSFGRPYISKIEGCVHDGWLILRNTCGLFYYDFLYYLLSSQYMYNQFCKKASGATVDNLNIDKVADAIVPIPPVEEQMRIVEQIEKIYQQLELLNNAQISYGFNVKSLKNKLINIGIQGKLTEKHTEDGTAEELYISMVEEKKQILKDRKGREDKNIKELDDEVPYELPANWKWVRFGEIGLFKKGPFGSALTKAMFVPKSDDTVKVYEQQHAIQKNSELGTYYITREYFDEKMSGFEVLPGDILVSCAGTIGETYILPDNIEQGIINQALMRVSLVPSVNKRFFQYYFDANLKKAAQEESNGSAIKNIPPFDVMKNWYFPLAPLSEQERIVEKMEELLSLI